MPYRYGREITEAERDREVFAMLGRGNHKSAQDEPAIVKQLLSKDIVHGFSMVIPLGAVPLIPNAMVRPVGLAKQGTLDEEEGNRLWKDWDTRPKSEAQTNQSRRSRSGWMHPYHTHQLERWQLSYLLWKPGKSTSS